MFELLFKYPVETWQEATLVFDSSWPIIGLPLALFFVLLLIVVTMKSIPMQMPRKLLVGALQIVFASVVLFMLWQPAIVVTTAEQGENAVAWLIDESTSMNQQDLQFDGRSSNQSRYQFAVDSIQNVLDSGDAGFQPEVYTIGRDLEIVEQADDLPPEAQSANSNLLQNLSTLLASVNDTSLAAVVLLSDGADNGETQDVATWQAIQAAGVPVHVVGIGSPNLANDIQLTDVLIPERVAAGAEVNAFLQIQHTRSANVRARVTSGDELLAAEDLTLPAGVSHSSHKLRFTVGERGIKQLEFSVELISPSENPNITPPADPNPANNRQPRLLEIIDDPKRILYVEGEPRWEYKFLRRALNGHPGVTIVSLLRTSPNKFYRQGVRNASELAEGFPITKEELFSYDAVIIGSLDAAELNTLQQSALRDFVSERGGSLLMLGGRQALADGGWGRSVVAAALPVALSNRLDAQTFERQRVRVVPTIAGLRTSWLQFSENELENIQAWQELPMVADHQALGSVKPGSVTLLSYSQNSNGGSRVEPLLVTQRYGRGQSLVLGTSGTWRWQMSLPSDDLRHEVFWRQLANNLVDNSLPRLSIDIAKPVFRDADSASIEVKAFNADFSPLQLAQFSVQLTDPDGKVSQVALPAVDNRPGYFRGDVAIGSAGAYVASATSPVEGEAPVSLPVNVERWWIGELGNAEVYNAGLNASFLQRIAESTGGQYLSASAIADISRVLEQDNAALKRENRLPIWDLPVFFLCLLLAKAFEWMLRLRWKRL